MNNKEAVKLRKILKPIVQECIREAIFEEGILSTLIAEIVTGVGATAIVENKQEKQIPQPKDNLMTSKVLKETKQRMLSTIGESNYANLKGVNIFEGTEPLRTAGNPDGAPSASPMANIDPDDKGVDIDSLVGLFGNKWNALK